MRRFAILIGCLLLVSCGGDSATASCDTTYWDGTIGTCLPEGWRVIDSETLRQRGVPEETIVAFQSEEAVSGQFPTVVVTKERLSQPLTNVRYAKASRRSVSVLPEYKRLDQRDITVAGTELQLHVFTAQPEEDQPRRRFYQVSITQEQTGFTFTGVAPVSIQEGEEQEMLLVMRNMAFEDPEEQEEE